MSLDNNDLVCGEYMRSVEELAAGKTYEQLVELLPYSKDNALHYDQICEILDLNGRTIRQMIQDARNGLVPICAGDEGVWIADTLDNWERYKKREFHKLKEQRRLCASLSRIDYQLKHSGEIRIPQRQMQLDFADHGGEK